MSGVLSALVALLHIIIVIGGASWYRFFGAGEEMAKMAEAGSFIPAIVTLSISVIFFIWAIYAFSGAKAIKKKLPFTKVVLVLISAIYLLRGLAILAAIFVVPEQIDSFAIWSSIISFIFGVFYAVGTKKEWGFL